MMLRNQKGFTLIEIIAVLVILGILAAVAVPKYFELTTQAQEKAVAAVGAEIQARISQKFAKQLLAGDTCTAALANIDTQLSGLGDGWTAGGAAWPADPTTGQTLAITLSHPTATGGVAKAYTLTFPTCGS